MDGFRGLVVDLFGGLLGDFGMVILSIGTRVLGGGLGVIVQSIRTRVLDGGTISCGPGHRVLLVRVHGTEIGVHVRLGLYSQAINGRLMILGMLIRVYTAGIRKEIKKRSGE